MPERQLKSLLTSIGNSEVRLLIVLESVSGFHIRLPLGPVGRGAPGVPGARRLRRAGVIVHPGGGSRGGDVPVELVRPSG